MSYKEAVIEKLKTIIKWGIISIVIGLAVGFVGVFFRILLEKVTQIRQNNNKIIFLLPFAGLLIVWLYRVLGMKKDSGTNLILYAVRNGEKISLKVSFLVFVSTIITHLFGGSAGREGAALQIGGSIANKIATFFKIGETDRKIATICGMGAGFSAIFGTPATATVFAMEVTTVGTMQYYAILPCMVSAIIGGLVGKIFGLSHESFPIEIIPQITVENFFKVIIIAMVCAVVSIFFCYCNKGMTRIFSEKIKNPYLRIFIGGAIIVIMSLIFGNSYNGAGNDIIHKSFITSVGFEMFLLKILFTSVTLGSGFKGGEIVPTFFIGSTLGNALAGGLNINSSFGAGIGMIALFCGVTNCPLTSIFMSLELFGKTESISFFALACAVSYVFSGMGGLYSAQKIRHIKIG